MRFRVVDGCPCPASIAPYVHLVLREAGQTASSIYRGDDAKSILHRHGKRTQREIHADPALASISNAAGTSQHELRSVTGGRLEEWEQGVDSGSDDHDAKVAINHAADRLGWKTRHPYKKGVEGHHWQFADRPRAKGVRQRAKIIRLRATLPRR